MAIHDVVLPQDPKKKFHAMFIEQVELEDRRPLG